MRLHMRFPTRFGTRTVVKQQLALEDAQAIAEWLRAHGGEASVSEDVDLLTIPQRLRNPRLRAKASAKSDVERAALNAYAAMAAFDCFPIRTILPMKRKRA